MHNTAQVTKISGMQMQTQLNVLKPVHFESNARARQIQIR